MKNKREARVAYYEGIRRATLDHFRVTEEGLRKLAGVSLSQTESWWRTFRNSTIAS